MKPVDTHCHLDFDQYDADREDVIRECGERLAAVVNIGTNVERNEAALALAQAYDIVSATMGLHPTYLEDQDPATVDRVIEQIREHAAEIVGIGEVGMDYYHVKEAAARNAQQDLFHRFISLAEELGLPVITHTRDAEKPSLDVLAAHDPVNVVMHCFNGALPLVDECVDCGYHVSVSTQVLYSNRVQEIAEHLPLEHMLLETDAPFLYRGDRNVPWHVAESAERIAELKDCTVDAVITQTTRNAQQILGI